MARFFFIFHALSFVVNFIFDRRFPLRNLQNILCIYDEAVHKSQRNLCADHQ